VKAIVNIGKTRNKSLKKNRGMVGVEAAIVLISFVIIAAAFSFMVVNMGLFATQRGKDTIQQGISQVSSPLMTDGSIYLRGTSDSVDAMVIPLKTIGTQYVSMAQNSTEITLRVGNRTAIADVYKGINDTNPYTTQFDTLVNAVGNSSTGAKLFIGNSNGGSSLDYSEKGFMVFHFSGSDQAAAREHIYIDIRPENGAPLSVEIMVPSDLTDGWLTVGS
jgi:flagellin FlaB